MESRKENRLHGYDYSENGAYFVTICSLERKCLFSRIVGGGVLDAPQVQLTEIGKIIDARIREMNAHYTHISVDKYVIMPNHLHLLISVTGQGTSRTPSPTNATIPSFVSTLKRMVSRACKMSLFQRSYYDHIIRSRKDYDEIWTYIDNNPKRWELDEFYI